MTLPDQARIAGFGVALGGLVKRRIPAPGVCSGNTNALLQEVHRSGIAHATTLAHKVVLSVSGTGGGIHDNDFKRRQGVPNPFKLGLHIFGGHYVTVRVMAKIELHAGLKAPFQRNLVNRDGSLPATRLLVHGGVKMIGSV